MRAHHARTPRSAAFAAVAPTFAVAVDPAVVEAASAVLGRPVAARPAVASRR